MNTLEQNEWRPLEPGELAEIGDEFYLGGEWLPASYAVPAAPPTHPNYWRTRRPRPVQDSAPAARECQCDMRTKLVGDGCSVCNPELRADLCSATSEAGEGAGGGDFDFRSHLQRQREWSERTFGPGSRHKGVVDHIRKELLEIEAAPDDITEWIDVVILALDGAWRAGASPDAIISALVAKQSKNEARTWPDWRTMSEDKAICHVKGEGAGGGAVCPHGIRYPWECKACADAAWEQHQQAAGGDQQNEPRTCPYCDQPRQDTFENRFRFECGTSLLKENGKTVKQGRECKLRVAYSKLLVDYCNLKGGAPSQASIDAAIADGSIVEPGDAVRLQRIRERLSDCLTAGGGDKQTAPVKGPVCGLLGCTCHWCNMARRAHADPEAFKDMVTIHARELPPKTSDQQTGQTADRWDNSTWRRIINQNPGKAMAAIVKLRDRADRAEAERDALRAERDRLREAHDQAIRFIKELNATKEQHGRQYRSRCGQFLTKALNQTNDQ